MAEINSRFGFGGANLNPGGTGKPTLATVLRDVADDLADSAGASASRHVEETVSVDTNEGLLMYEPDGFVLYADEGGVGGAKTRRAIGESLAAGEYSQDDTNPRKLLFAAADSVASAQVGYQKAMNQPAMLSSAAEPFALTDADDLSISVDGADPETATFNTGDFVDIANATAAEVAAVLETDIAGLTAEDIGGVLVIRSDTLGPDSKIQVTGGLAAAKLTLDTDEHVGSGVRTRKV